MSHFAVIRMLRADRNLFFRLLLGVAFAVFVPLPAALDACESESESDLDTVEQLSCEHVVPTVDVRVTRNRRSFVAVCAMQVRRVVRHSPLRSEHAARNGIGTALRL